MKKSILLFLVFLTGMPVLQAQDKAQIKKLTAKELKAKHIKEQMLREKKFAHEQRFYQGKEYNLSAQKVDPKDLDSIPSIEPDFDFDMTDVYRDDI